MLNKLFQPLATCFNWFQGETHVSHHFTSAEASWCLCASCLACVAAEWEGKGNVDPGGDALLLNSNHPVILLNKQMYKMGEERRLILVIS